ncbi:DUF4190 domain-containing protein [Streptomyces sp. SPB074]|uniref:DUF4190 domain-containing protein n=1 Tax=Streptomyces sp. (strain SPB074) TaxID=465543 RepID=UPI00055C1D8C|nr:DUF4190 domain-containing protein [Streptomyces sp. SPB074]
MSHSPEDSERPGGAGERLDLSKPPVPEQPPGEPGAASRPGPPPQSPPHPYGTPGAPYGQAPGAPYGHDFGGPYDRAPVGGYDQVPGGGYGPGPYGQAPGPVPGQEPWGPGYGASWQGQTPPGGGLAVAALVCGIAAVVLCWTIAGGIILGVLGLVFGIIAMRRSQRTGAPNRGLGIAGLVLGGVGVIGGAVTLGLVVTVASSDEVHDSFRSFRDYSDCLQHAQSPEDQRECKERFDRQVGN